MPILALQLKTKIFSPLYKFNPSILQQLLFHPACSIVEISHSARWRNEIVARFSQFIRQGFF